MELANSIFHFFTDKTKKLPHKVIFGLFTILFIVIVDNLLSFSFSYNNSNKIEQIQGINNILNDTSLTKYEKNKLLILRKNIVDHSTWKDNTYDFLTSIEFKNDNKIKNQITPNSKEIKQNLKVRNYYWHFFSSSWPFLLLMIIFPFIGLFDKNTPFWQAIGIIILFEPFLLGFCWVYAKIFSFIPVLFNNPTYNYFLNTILCISSIWIFTLFDKKNKKAS